MALLESGENYLEAILVLEQQVTFVRSIDIAKFLAFSKPSVSRAVMVLKRDGYIDVDVNGIITLSDQGRNIAETIYERHQFMCEVLMMLGVDEKTASEDACRIEHVLSQKSFDCIKKHASQGMLKKH